LPIFTPRKITGAPTDKPFTEPSKIKHIVRLFKKCAGTKNQYRRNQQSYRAHDKCSDYFFVRFF
jgi:hypothetical protein